VNLNHRLGLASAAVPEKPFQPYRKPFQHALLRESLRTDFSFSTGIYRCRVGSLLGAGGGLDEARRDLHQGEHLKAGH
jgi:hypothetical protein